MAEKKTYKIAPRVALTSKGGILGEGTEVTAENFASEDVFNTLVKAKKIMTADDYSKRLEELTNPEKAAKTASKKDSGKTEGTDGNGGQQ